MKKNQLSLIKFEYLTQREEKYILFRVTKKGNKRIIRIPVVDRYKVALATMSLLARL